MMSTLAVESFAEPLSSGRLIDLREANANTLREMQNGTINEAPGDKKRRSSGSRCSNKNKEDGVVSPLSTPRTTPPSTTNNNNINTPGRTQHADEQKAAAHGGDAPSTSPEKRTPHRKRGLGSSGSRRVVKRPHRNDDESCDSDEECYSKSLKERKPLETMERAGHIEMREKMDQARVNRLFFDRSRHPEWKEQQALYQSLIEANLWCPPPLPAGYSESDCDPFHETTPVRKHIPPATTATTSATAGGPSSSRTATTTTTSSATAATSSSSSSSSAGVPIPAFQLVSPIEDYDHVISRRFFEQYKKGLLRDAEYEQQIRDEEQAEVESVSHEEHVAAALPTDRKVPLWRRVADLFSPLEWSDEESALFEELVRIYGSNFGEISRIICGCKTLGQLHLYCRNAWGYESPGVDISDTHRRHTCHLCFISQQNIGHNQRGARSHHNNHHASHKRARPNHSPNNQQLMVVCGACERGYHLACLNPPLPDMPSGSWFCSDDCLEMSQLNCQVCGTMENDEQMLLCDTCNKGYHIFCLSPPMSAIPEGDWNCPQCSSSAFSSSSSSYFSSPSLNNHKNNNSPSTNSPSIVASRAIPPLPLLLLSPTPTRVSPERNGSTSNSCSSNNNSTLKLSSSQSLTKCKHLSNHFLHSLSSSGNPSFTPYPSIVVSSAAKLASFMSSSSPLSLSVLTLRRLGDRCVQCILDGGLLDGDYVVNKSARLSKMDDSPSVFKDFYSVSSLKDTRGEEELMRHFDVILAAVSIATQNVYNDAVQGAQQQPQPQPHRVSSLPPELLVNSSPSSSSSSSSPLCASPSSSSSSATPETDEAANNVRRSSRKRRLPDNGTQEQNRRKRHSTGSINSNSSSSIINNDVYNMNAVEDSSGGEFFAEAPPGPRCWIFSFNPLIKDMAGMMKPNVRVEWQVRQHAESIKKGDRVFIWTCGKSAGICASAFVIDNPTPVPIPTNSIYNSRNPNRIYRTTVQVSVPLSRPIPKPLLCQQPDLVELTILKSPVATNFRVSPAQEAVLNDIFQQHCEADGAINDVTNNHLTSSPPSSPYATYGANYVVSTNASQQCYVCKKVDSGPDMLLCSGCRDWYHSTCTDSALSGAQPFFCPECASLNSQVCSVCNKAESHEELLSCNNCDRAFHLQCTKPAMTHMPASWLCASCMVTSSDLMTCKLAIGWRELRAECNRLMQLECEHLGELHRKNILSFNNRKQVLSRMRGLTSQLRDRRQHVIAAATNRFQYWARALIFTKNNNNTPPPSPTPSPSPPTASSV